MSKSSNISMLALTAALVAALSGVASGADARSSILRRRLEGSASVKVDVQGRDPHPAISLLHRIEDLNEERFYSGLGWLEGRDEVITIGWDGFVTVWNAVTGDLGFRVRPAGDVRLSAFAAVKGRDQVVVVGERGVILLISTRDGALLREWRDPSGDWLTSVTVADDGGIFVTGSQQGDLAFWRAADTRPEAVWRAHVWPVRRIALALSPGGRFIYSADPAGIKLWNIDTGELVRAFGDPATGGAPDPLRWWFSSVNFSGDGAYVIAGGYDGARVLDLASGEPLRTFAGLPMGVLSTALDEAAGEVVTVVRDYTIRFFDVETGVLKRMTWVPVQMFGVLTDSVVNARGDLLAVASNDPIFSRMGSFPVLRIYRYSP